MNGPEERSYEESGALDRDVDAKRERMAAHREFKARVEGRGGIVGFETRDDGDDKGYPVAIFYEVEDSAGALALGRGGSEPDKLVIICNHDQLRQLVNQGGSE